VTDGATLADIEQWAAFDAVMDLPADCREARTRVELSEHYGISREAAEKIAEQRVQEGTMCRVRKRVRNGHFVTAYLPVEK
jgi:hypothetical protein